MASAGMYGRVSVRVVDKFEMSCKLLFWAVELLRSRVPGCNGLDCRIHSRLCLVEVRTHLVDFCCVSERIQFY